MNPQVATEYDCENPPMKPWTYDGDSSDTFMVYDPDLPDTAPVVCREVREEENARLIALAPELYNYVAGSAQMGCVNAKALLLKLNN